MPSKTKTAAAAAAALPPIPKELIDRFVSGPMSAEAVNAASMASSSDDRIQTADNHEGACQFHPDHTDPAVRWLRESVVRLFGTVAA